MNWSLTLGILGGILLIASSIVQWKDKRQEEKKASQNALRADNSAKMLADMQVKHLHKTEELSEAYKEISELQTEIRNQITGGKSKPILKLISSQINEHKESGRSYYVLFFDLINNGSYSVQNVKVRITDMLGYVMPSNGIRHFNTGLSAGTDQGSSAKSWALNYNPFYAKDIGAVTPNNTYHIHTTTFSPDENNSESFYNVEIEWRGGTIIYFITLKNKHEKLIIDKIEIVENGEVVKDDKSYIIFG